MAGALPIIAVGATVAGAGISAYSQYRAGREEARMHERLAKERREAARREAEDTKKRHQAILAAQRALYGASGVTMEGSPLMVQIHTMKESEEQLARIVESGERLSYWEEREARRARTAGYFGTAGEILGGVSSVMQIGREYEWW